MLSLTTYDINKELKSYKCFKGTYAKNLLPIKIYKQRPLAFVINTDKSDKPGEHWVALFINDDHAEYFDSFGITPICCEIYKLLKLNNINTLEYNKYELQSYVTSTCGAYCILFLKMRCNDVSYSKFIDLFSNNRLMNDIIVSKVYKSN